MFMCVFSLYWMIWNLHQTLFKLHCVDIKKNILARQQAISVKKNHITIYIHVSQFHNTVHMRGPSSAPKSSSPYFV